MIADITLQALTDYEEAAGITITDKTAFLASYNDEIKKAAALAAATNHIDNVLGYEYVTWDGVSDVVMPLVTMNAAQFTAHIQNKHYYTSGEVLFVKQGATVIQMQCRSIGGNTPLDAISAAQLAADLRDEHINGLALETIFNDTLQEIGFT